MKNSTVIPANVGSGGDGTLASSNLNSFGWMFKPEMSPLAAATKRLPCWRKRPKLVFKFSKARKPKVSIKIEDPHSTCATGQSTQIGAVPPTPASQAPRANLFAVCGGKFRPSTNSRALARLARAHRQRRAGFAPYLQRFPPMHWHSNPKIVACGIQAIHWKEADTERRKSKRHG